MTPKKVITIEDILKFVYEGGKKDGREQVSRGWQHHYDLLVNPHIREEEDRFIEEMNKTVNDTQQHAILAAQQAKDIMDKAKIISDQRLKTNK